MRRPFRLAIPLALAVLVLAIFRQAGSFPFINLDDDVNLLRNPYVQEGLTLESVRWAFTSAGYIGWLPATWLSHLADVSLFGMDAGAHHRVNVLFHLANTLLLFGVLREMTGREWESGFVAALFAAHPLHVEPVVWISERKELLGAFFWLLATGAYVRYARRPGAARYAAVALFFILGLLSKPTVVTLPFAFLLLDYWPLGRLRLPGDVPGDGEAPLPPVPLRRLLLEKAPLLALSAAVSFIAWRAAVEAGAVAPLDALPAGSRLANGVRAIGLYLRMTVFPSGLAVLYPHPGISPDPAEVAAGALLLSVPTVLAAIGLRRRKWLAFGWLWFLGTMVPMVGIVQVGRHAIADRYTYLPLIGLFLAAVWGVSDLAGRFRGGRARFAVAGCALVVLLAASSWRQAGYWRDSVTLFERALRVTSGNWLIENSLGVERARRGERSEAIAHFREAVRLNPGYDYAWFNLGMEMEKAGDLEEAKRCYREGLRINPGDPDALARLLMLGGRPPWTGDGDRSSPPP